MVNKEITSLLDGLSVLIDLAATCQGFGQIYFFDEKDIMVLRKYCKNEQEAPVAILIMLLV